MLWLFPAVRCVSIRGMRHGNESAEDHAEEKAEQCAGKSKPGGQQGHELGVAQVDAPPGGGRASRRQRMRRMSAAAMRMAISVIERLMSRLRVAIIFRALPQRRHGAEK